MIHQTITINTTASLTLLTSCASPTSKVNALQIRGVYWRLFRTIVILIAACAAFGGCVSTGPQFADIRDSIPPLDAAKARIYFYRDASMIGAAIQPDIRLNGEVVGASQPGGFFFTDRPSGRFEISLTTEVENRIEFSLKAGETQYIRTYVSIGILVGRAYPELVDPGKALGDMANLHYVGDLGLLAAAKSRAESTPAPQTNQRQTPQTVNLDDLKDLLPAEDVK